MRPREVPELPKDYGFDGQCDGDEKAEAEIEVGVGTGHAHKGKLVGLHDGEGRGLCARGGCSEHSADDVEDGVDHREDRSDTQKKSGVHFSTPR